MEKRSERKARDETNSNQQDSEATRGS
jgi:hypothetical protein